MKRLNEFMNESFGSWRDNPAVQKALNDTKWNISNSEYDDDEIIYKYDAFQKKTGLSDKQIQELSDRSDEDVSISVNKKNNRIAVYYY